MQFFQNFMAEKYIMGFVQKVRINPKKQVLGDP